MKDILTGLGLFAVLFVASCSNSTKHYYVFEPLLQKWVECPSAIQSTTQHISCANGKVHYFNVPIVMFDEEEETK